MPTVWRDEDSAQLPDGGLIPFRLQPGENPARLQEEKRRVSSQGQSPLSPGGRAARLRRLDFLWLELTRKCNLRCVHCYADSGPDLPLNQGMMYEDWLQVLRQAFALGCREVQFIGGEPTLCPDLPQLISDARKIGFVFVEVYTNGTILSRKLRERLVEDQADLAFSVYGSRAEVHDGVTGGSGSFARTLDNIRWALEVGLPVRASIIGVPSNAGDIRTTRSLLRRLGVKSIDVDQNRGVGRGSGLVAAKSFDPLDELCGDCWRGKLAIDPGGNVFPCVFSRFCRVGHVSQSLASILQSEQLYSFRKEVWNMSNGKCAPTKLKQSKAKRKSAAKAKRKRAAKKRKRK
jgi:radical SAM protein with 4Fe4S-binding SPASM domain